MRIAICDDEKVFAENILRKLKFEFGKRSQECSFVTVNRGEELLDICSKEKIDVVFLDIMMPVFDGFNIAERLRQTKKDIMIVFVSNKENTVFSSYKYNPIWFIPKNQMQFVESVVDKIINRMKENEEDLSLVQIKMGSRVVELDIRKIKYFKTEGHYINYFCNDGYKSESFRCPKCEVEMQLEGLWFVKTHNRYLVNIRQIHSISNNAVTLSDREKIPISRAQLDVVRDKFQDYLRSIR